MRPVWGARFRITRHSETARVRALLALEVAFWEIEGQFLRLTGRQRACPNGPPGEKIPSFVRVSDDPPGVHDRSLPAGLEKARRIIRLGHSAPGV
jgi:hypothetical protein